MASVDELPGPRFASARRRCDAPVVRTRPLSPRPVRDSETDEPAAHGLSRSATQGKARHALLCCGSARHPIQSRATEGGWEAKQSQKPELYHSLLITPRPLLMT